MSKFLLSIVALMLLWALTMVLTGCGVGVDDDEYYVDHYTEIQQVTEVKQVGVPGATGADGVDGVTPDLTSIYAALNELQLANEQLQQQIDALNENTIDLQSQIDELNSGKCKPKCNEKHKGKCK